MYSDPHATSPAAAGPGIGSSDINNINNNGAPPATVQSPPPPLPPLQTSASAEDDSDYDSAGAAFPQARARQLVDQFATLASRLGIDLPDTVLQSLTSAAARNDPTLNPGFGFGGGSFGGSFGGCVGVGGARSLGPRPAGAGAPPTVLAPSDENNDPRAKNDAAAERTAAKDAAGHAATSGERLPVAPTVVELLRTAEESIAAVTKKRPPPGRGSGLTSSGSKHPSENDLEDSDDDDDDDDAATTATGNNSGGSGGGKPTYVKRRKKPRLSDCESRLAHLKAENEQLKRHLQNVSNKAHKFDREKEEAGRRIAILHQQDAGSDEMNRAVQQFTDMYSDYGVNRQQELSFHLEQLQR